MIRKKVIKTSVFLTVLDKKWKKDCFQFRHLFIDKEYFWNVGIFAVYFIYKMDTISDEIYLN